MLDLEPETFALIELAGSAGRYEVNFRAGDAVYLTGAKHSFGKILGFTRLKDPEYAVEHWPYFRHGPRHGRPRVNPYACRHVTYCEEVFDGIHPNYVQGWDFPDSATCAAWGNKTEFIVVKHVVVKKPRIRVHHQYNLVRFKRWFWWKMSEISCMWDRMDRIRSA